MPKLIENVRTQLLQEAQKQVTERGYAKTTIRSVAEACGVAVGTVYNYYPSKEILVASFMADTWTDCLSRIKAGDPSDPKEYLRGLYETLRSFAERHKTMFADQEAEKAFMEAFPARHRMLREQLAELTAPICKGADDFPARFVADALLTWIVEGEDFERLWPLLSGAIK